MKLTATLLLFWFISSLSATAWGNEATELYVAVDGNDQNSGTREQPFSTIARARDAIRSQRASGGLPTGGVTVWIRGGIYELHEPLVLDKQDSAEEDAPIVYRAMEGEKVQLTGSRQVSDFRSVTDESILTRLDVAARGHVLVADLRTNGVEDLGQVAAAGKRLEVFFHDRPMQLARWPNEGFTQIVNVIGATPRSIHGIAGTKEGWFTYEGDRPSRWSGEPDVWLHGYWFWDWSDSLERIASVDAVAKTIRLEPPYHQYGYRKGQRYYALNCLCELDRPGEWYVDREQGLLYFWPPGSIDSGRVTVSLLPELLRIQNCTGVVFRDLVFEQSRATAIKIVDCHQCRIEGCTIRNTGAAGTQIQGGTDCVVRDCQLYNLGEGGVSLSGGDRKMLAPARHACISNHIHHFGRLFRTYRPAVGVGGVGNRVTHNLIHDGPHNAIQLGGNDHLIEFNEIHHVCMETGDVGAFYTGRDWTQRGTIIRHNYFHHIQGPGLYGAMAVYLDDAASGFQIVGNVFYLAGRAAFIGGGRDNLVENNLFVDCNPSVHVDARGVGWMRETVDTTLPERLEAMPYRESPWKDRYPELLTILEDEPGLPQGNIVRRNISWGGKWLDAEDKAKPLIVLEKNLVDQDPLFEGAPRASDGNILDFRLMPSSPAWKQGFEPIPLEKIGLLK